MFPVEVTFENSSEANPVTEDVYYGRVARHRTWSSRRHMGGTRSPHGMCLQSLFLPPQHGDKKKKKKLPPATGKTAQNSCGHLQVPVFSVSNNTRYYYAYSWTAWLHCTEMVDPLASQYLGSRMNLPTDDKWLIDCSENASLTAPNSRCLLNPFPPRGYNHTHSILLMRAFMHDT